MSLSSTPTLKSHLAALLGPVLARKYFVTLNDFFHGRISRDEFDDSVRSVFKDAQGSAADIASSASDDRLVQIHNALIISLFDATTHHRRSGLLGIFQANAAQAALLNGEDGLLNGRQQAPPRKRRRIMRGNGSEEDQLGARSERLTKWAIGVGRPERDRIKRLPMPAPSAADGETVLNGLVNFSGAVVTGLTIPLQPTPTTTHVPQLRSTKDMAEVSMERGVILLKERDDPAGSRLPIQLCSLTHAPVIQHLSDRVNLVSAQHELSSPSKDVASLLMLALEFKLKQLLTHALTLTHSGLAVNSISTGSSRGGLYGASSGGILTAAALDTLFTIAPADVPQRSAAMTTRLALGDERDDDDGSLMLVRDKEVIDERWQLIALLAERSAVRDALRRRGG